jgi:hypothetical protein
MASGYKTLLARYPEMRFWLKLGLPPRTARALVAAGYLTATDLDGKSREEILALPAFGMGSLAVVEKCLGSPLPSRKPELEERGIPTRTARALGRANISSMARLGRMTREQFLNTQGLSALALRHCERVLGHEIVSPLAELRRLGLRPAAAYKLSVAGVRAVEELVNQRDSELRAMGLREEDIELIRRRHRKG